MARVARLALLGCCLLAAPALVVHALSAGLTFQLNNGTSVGPQSTTALPPSGNCTSSCQSLPEGLNLTGNKTAPPILVTVAGAPSGSAVVVVAYSTSDCTGSNSTSTFFNFQTSSVSVDSNSSFPGYVQSFLLCSATPS